MPSVPNLTPDPLLPEYRWNNAAKRPIDSNGRFVSQATIRLELDNVLDNISDRLGNLGTQLRMGQIDGPAFQYEAMNLIKQTHLAGAAMERGGWYQMNSSDFGRVGQRVRSEYGYFRNLLAEIESGKQRLDGTLNVRLKLYGQAGRDTFHNFERETKAEQGYDQERNVLHGRDHCGPSKSRPGCVDVTRAGWYPIGEMPPVGSRTCHANCRCTVEYRNSQTGEVFNV